MVQEAVVPFVPGRPCCRAAGLTESSFGLPADREEFRAEHPGGSNRRVALVPIRGRGRETLSVGRNLWSATLSVGRLRLGASRVSFRPPGNYSRSGG